MERAKVEVDILRIGSVYMLKTQLLMSLEDDTEELMMNVMDYVSALIHRRRDHFHQDHR